MTLPIRIALVEDEPRLRHSMQLLLSSDPELRCVAAYASAEEVPDGLSENGVDLLLLDINLPGERGSLAVRRFRERDPKLAILMLTVHEDPERVFESLCNGASGYVLKKTAPAKLLAAIHDAHQGGAPLSPEIARMVIEHFRGAPPRIPDDPVLTDQETRLLRRLADGETYQQAAATLGISINTVRNYVRSIYEKLHVHSASAAVSKALRARLI